MNKQEIQTKAMDLVRSEIRTGKLSSYSDIMDYIPKIFSSIGIDKTLVANSIKRAIWESGEGNPLNAILKILGVRLVSSKNLECNTSEKTGTLDDALKLDETLLAKVVQQMSQALAAHENTSKCRDDSNKELINELHDKLDEECAKNRKLSANYHGLQETVAVRIQYILSLVGQSGTMDSVAQQVQELMEDMQLKAYWNAENTGFTEAQMFTVLKTDNPSEHKVKPCMTYKGEVIVQGVLFAE